MSQHLFAAHPARVHREKRAPYRITLFFVVVVLSTCGLSDAAIQRVDPSTVPPVIPPITFSEVPINTLNPSFAFTGVPTYGDLTVSFGSLFEGQTLAATPNSLIDSSPSSPLMFKTGGPDVATAIHLDHDVNPSITRVGLGGFIPMNMYFDLYFSTPISMLFSQPVTSVVFKLGSLDRPGTTLIEAYDANGVSLGSFFNAETGFQTIGLADENDLATISGVSIYVPNGGMDWEGFVIDDVFVGPRPTPIIPEPATSSVWGLLGMCAAILVYRKRRV